MATVMWSNLPSDVLLLVAKILNSDVDTIRLRSICSQWRNSIRRRYRPSSLPLQLPPLFCSREDALRRGAHYYLQYSTFYRFSPPDFGPEDPSDGWLVRVLEVNPNTFSLLAPLIPEKIYHVYPLNSSGKFDLTLVPKHLNLLDFRVSEICKCYTVECSNPGLAENTGMAIISKVIVLWDYGVDCDFAVMVLLKLGSLCCWKFGDKEWTEVASKDYDLVDVVLHDGKCFAISRQGVLVFIDSKFNLNVAPLLSPLPVDKIRKHDFYLVDWNSELYVVYKYYDQGKDNPNCSDEIALEVKIFKKGSNWEYIKCLGDDVFVFCIDVSFGISMKDFRDCKGNTVYFSTDKILPYSRGYMFILYAVHDLDDGRTSVKNLGKGRTVTCMPTPKWLSSS